MDDTNRYPTLYDRDVYESSNLRGTDSFYAPSRLLEENQPTSGISGVFEGTAGGGTLDVIKSGVTPDPEAEPAVSAAYEFFKQKSFKAINFEDGFTINSYLGKEQRRTYETDGSTKLSRADTMKQLETVSKSHMHHLLETPVQRVTRLQLEVSEMLDFVKVFSETRNITPTSPIDSPSMEDGRRFFGADPLVLLNELRVLQNHLNGVAATESFKALAAAEDTTSEDHGFLALHTATIAGTPANVVPGTASLESSALNSIVEHLSLVEKGLKDSKSVGGSPEGNVAPFVYELYTVPSPGTMFECGRLLDLERRLAELERLLGLEKSLQWGLPFTDVSSALKEVVSRLMLLHPGRLDVLMKRFQVDDLLHRKERMSAVQHVTPPSPQGNAAKMIDGTINNSESILRLYDFCESTRSSVSALPTIIRRLKTLKALHIDAAALGSRISSLETQQSQLIDLVDTMETEFDSFRTSMITNISWAREVVESIQRRKLEVQMTQ